MARLVATVTMTPGTLAEIMQAPAPLGITAPSLPGVCPPSPTETCLQFSEKEPVILAATRMV